MHKRKERNVAFLTADELERKLETLTTIGDRKLIWHDINKNRVDGVPVSDIVTRAEAKGLVVVLTNTRIHLGPRPQPKPAEAAA